MELDITKYHQKLKAMPIDLQVYEGEIYSYLLFSLEHLFQFILVESWALMDLAKPNFSIICAASKKI